MIQRSVLLFGAGCLCSRGSAAEEAESNCCFTPNIEPESLRISAGTIRVDLTKARTLENVPSAAYILDAERGLQLIVVRRSRRQFVACSRLCTHAAQVVSYIEKRGLLQCNGFNHSTFDLEGKVYKGPAEKALTRYRTKLTGQTLAIEIGGDAS